MSAIIDFLDRLRGAIKLKVRIYSSDFALFSAADKYAQTTLLSENEQIRNCYARGRHYHHSCPI